MAIENTFGYIILTKVKWNVFLETIRMVVDELPDNICSQ